MGLSEQVLEVLVEVPPVELFGVERFARRQAGSAACNNTLGIGGVDLLLMDAHVTLPDRGIVTLAFASET